MKKILSQDEKFQRMLEAPLPGLIGKLAVPTIISMLITSFYNMADTFFVGKIGTSATAAVGVVFPLMSIIQALGFFFGHGSGNSISRKLGAKEHDSAEQLASAGFFSALFCGLLIAVFGLLFLKPLALALGSTDTILPYTEDYLGIILLGAPYMTAQLVLNNQLRFQGSAFYAMIGITSGAVLNIILDPLFIFVFDMGISGAALATVISQFVSFVLLLLGSHFAGCIPIRLKNIRCIPKCFSEIAKGGLPSLFRQGLGSVATIALNLAANPYGDAAIAAMSIVMRITFFASSALIGFGQGFQPVCGFNYGARRYDRVREAFWFCVRVSSVFSLIAAVVGFALSPQLIGIFRKGDAEVIQIGTTALRMQCLTFPLLGWITLNNMLFQTIGKTVPASVLASARQGIFFFPAIFLLPLFLNLTGIQLAQPVADLATFALSIPLNLSVIRELKTMSEKNSPL